MNNTEQLTKQIKQNASKIANKITREKPDYKSIEIYTDKNNNLKASTVEKKRIDII